MTYRTAGLIASGLALVMFAGAFWAWHAAGVDRVAVHFGPEGTPDGWMPAPMGWFIIPLLASLTIGVFLTLPLVSEGVRRSEKPYGVTLVLVTGVFAVSQAVILAPVFDVQISPPRTLTFAGGVLLAGIGNLLGKVRRNAVFGLRTPWTLKDEWVWDQTHRVGGRIFVVAGIALMLAALVSPAGVGLFRSVLLIVLAAVLFPCLQSYVLWRERQAGTEPVAGRAGGWVIAMVVMAAVLLALEGASRPWPWAAPSAGTEESLRRYILSLQSGAPNYHEMTPQLADVVHRQRTDLQAKVQSWGALSAVTFKGVDLRGFDTYDVEFERGRAEWKIGPLTPDGRVAARRFREIR